MTERSYLRISPTLFPSEAGISPNSIDLGKQSRREHRWETPDRRNFVNTQGMSHCSPRGHFVERVVRRRIRVPLVAFTGLDAQHVAVALVLKQPFL